MTQREELCFRTLGKLFTKGRFLAHIIIAYIYLPPLSVIIHISSCSFPLWVLSNGGLAGLGDSEGIFTHGSLWYCGEAARGGV